MSERRGMMGVSAEQVIRPPTSGWLSAGGVPDAEPRDSAHSSGAFLNTPSRTAESTAEFLRRIDRERASLKTRRALADLDRRTGGRVPTRSERRLRARYLRILGNQQGTNP